MNEIKVSTENVQKAFHAAGENPAIQELLINLFGKENVEPIHKPKEPKAVTDRIKTFEDACKELGEEHLFVKQYNSNEMADVDTDLDAYLKLRIICASLNEGWEPKFEEDEYRYYPWFELMTKEEIANMDEEDKGRVVCRSYSSAGANGGLVYASSVSVSSNAYTYDASRLVFKSLELAEYAGRQFVDIWADFVFKAG